LSIILIGNLVQEFDSFSLEQAVRWAWFAIALTASWGLARSSKLTCRNTNYA
jgi:hypothetical protein